MNLLIIERNIVSNLLTIPLKSQTFNPINCHFIHSKSCIQRNVIKNNSLLSTRCPNLFLKRDINYGKIRKYYRIIRLKDRGVEHNFRKDRIDPKTNILVYKAEVNRICTLGGVLFPAITIFGCIAARISTFFDSDVEVDPHHKPSFLEKYFYEIIILVSILHISLSKRYVLRMYYNNKRNVYTMSTWRWYLPFTTHTVECAPGSAQMSTWVSQNAVYETASIMFGNTRIDRKRYFINEEEFIYPLYYNVLFGFTSPDVLKELDSRLTEEHNRTADQLIRQREKDMSSVSNF